MTSAIELVEAQLVQRITPALTRPGQALPVIEVRAWPNQPDKYKLSHPLGAALVIYKGARFDQSGAMAGQHLKWEASFEVGVVVRTLRDNKQGTADDMGDGLTAGAYDVLAAIRGAVGAWSPPASAGATRLVSEAFDGYSEGTWGYSLQIVVPMFTVQATPEVPGPFGLNEPANLTMATLQGPSAYYDPSVI